DNEAYMNTGVQKSGLTPYGTKTTTSPVGNNLPGAVTHKKNLFEIIAAHDIAYAATASVGYPQDYLNKLTKAARVEGTSYIHIYATCPTGWGTSTETSVSLAKEAVDCGLWYLAEYENSIFKINRKLKKPELLKEHLLKQGRFKHLTDENIQVIESERDHKWARMLEKWG
ncbi:MAG: hypothetical protein KAR21_12165, partial [Spirochaetales bacterium]|nr:hypothetical protein [Spirochaetales bacterium]